MNDLIQRITNAIFRNICDIIRLCLSSLTVLGCGTIAF